MVSDIHKISSSEKSETHQVWAQILNNHTKRGDITRNEIDLKYYEA